MMITTMMKTKIEFEEIIEVRVDSDSKFSYDKLLIKKMNLEQMPMDPEYPNDITYKFDSFEHDDMINTIKSKPLDISKVKKIYIHETATIPRIKLRIFCDKHGSSITRDQKEADVIIAGEKYFSVILGSTNSDLYEKDYYLWFINKSCFDICKGIDELREAIKQNSNYVLSNYSARNKFQNYMSTKERDAFYQKSLSLDDMNITYINNKSSEDLSVLEAGFNKLLDPTSNVYHENSILDIVNQGPVMDKEMYTRIKDMFESDDKANHVLAMEIMANCDYNKSFVYLSFLFKDYFNSQINSSGKKNNVNFKSLTKFMNGRYNLSFDNILENLGDRDLLTQTNYLMVKEALIEELNIEGGKSNYTITDIQLTQELQDKLQEDPKEIVEQIDKIESL